MVENGKWKNILRAYLVDSDNVSEIQSNGTSSIFIRRNGKREEVKNIFSSEQDYFEQTRHLVKAINPSFDLENDKMEFLEEGRLILKNQLGEQCGTARVHIVLPPVSDLPQVTIAKKSGSLATIDNIFSSGSMSGKMLNFIKAAIDCKMNIIFSGGTGAGKALIDTTLIPTPTGLVPMKEINVGDVIYTPFGTETIVQYIFNPFVNDAYLITFNKGEQVIACADHNWYVYNNQENILKLTTKDLFADERYKKVYIKPQKRMILNGSSDKHLYRMFQEVVGEYFYIKRGEMIFRHRNKNILSEIHEELYPFGLRPTEIVYNDNDNIYTFKLLLSEEIKNVLCKYDKELYSSVNTDDNKITIEKIERIEVTPEMNFLCFTVEDESHQFLATEHFIPTGNTTMLEAVSKLIPMDTRIGVVEDSPELVLIQPNVTYLHSKPWQPGMDQNKEVTLDWCVRQINRMRTDLLIVGETRGKEFKEFLTGANSGMEGSMSTIHANDPKRALKKMSAFVQEGSSQPIRTINENIASTLDIIIQLNKNLQGVYRCDSIEEISNILSTDESATIATTTLSKYVESERNWTDTFLISDKMRTRLKENGYDTYTFKKVMNFNGMKTSLPTLD